MKEIKGDLLEGDWDAAFHCANAYCTMGSGIAYFLRKKWPAIYEADLETEELKPDEKLGWFTYAGVGNNQIVYNLYGQQGIGNDGTVLGRNCLYDYLYNAMYRACAHLCRFKDGVMIGVPKYMGCCRAGGNWAIVSAMLQTLEEEFPVEFIIYDIENGENDVKIQSSTSIKEITN